MLIVWLCAFSLVQFAHAQSEDDGYKERGNLRTSMLDDDEIKDKIDSFIQSAMDCLNLPGLSIAVVKDGEVSCRPTLTKLQKIGSLLSRYFGKLITN